MTILRLSILPHLTHSAHLTYTPSCFQRISPRQLRKLLCSCSQALTMRLYSLARNAGGTFTVDGAKWAIDDSKLGIVTTLEGTDRTPGVYGTTGHLTVTIDGSAL